MSQINIGNLTIDKFYIGDSSDVKVYLGAVKLYPSEEPQPVLNCYSVISSPISDYTSTDYNSVFSFADTKWYMLNNLNQYEEYGIYETGTSLSDFTHYPNKLVAIGETEYQYQSNGWVEVGEYIVDETTYEVTDDPHVLTGNELLTTFKIPFADIEDVGNLDFEIYIEGGDKLLIRNSEYRFESGTTYEGTVTNDGEYYYYSLPNEAPSSVIIESTEYYESNPIHLIFGPKQVSVEYVEKEIPTAKVYNTVEEMEAVGCPTVGVGQYGVVGDDVYQFEETEEWVNKPKSGFKFVAKYNDGNANVIVCNTSNELSKGDTQPSYLSNKAMTDAYIGDCVTSIGENALYGCINLTSVTMPNTVTSIGNNAFGACRGLKTVTIPNSVTSIGTYAFFNCINLTSVTMPNTVTSIGNNAFQTCTSLKTVTIPNSVTSIGGSAFFGCSKLTSIWIGNSVTSIGTYAFFSCTSLLSVEMPNTVTSIGNNAFQGCSKLTNVTVLATTPPVLGTSVFNDTNNCPIYVPSASVYKTATNWSTYASRIKEF